MGLNMTNEELKAQYEALRTEYNALLDKQIESANARLELLKENQKLSFSLYKLLNLLD
jgi:hypothetical protein